MGSAYYSPLLWLVIAAVVFGIFTVTNVIGFFKKKWPRTPKCAPAAKPSSPFLGRMRWLLWGIAAAMTLCAAATPFFEKKEDAETAEMDQETAQTGTISLLQTTDVHCQIHPHVEFFLGKRTGGFSQNGGLRAYREAVRQGAEIEPKHLYY